MAKERPLGRREPPDFKHVERYPLSAAPGTAAPGSPVVLGIDWYSNFDKPVLDNGRYWIGRGGLGSIRGGHAICVKPGVRTDPLGWWDFYNQGNEGACVGFSESRMMSLYNRTRYDARWLYKRAQETDDWPGENYSGTSVRAGMNILRLEGHKRPAQDGPVGGAGIAAYRWLTTVDEILTVIAMPLARTLGAVPLLNSWGKWYPHITWMPGETLDRLLGQYGEATVATDR